jgi:hypothetical protein
MLERRQLLLASCALLWSRVASAAPSANLDLWNALCDLVIPATSTPGAVAAGVPAFLDLALEANLTGAQPGWAQTLQNELRAFAGGKPFLSLDPAGRQKLLAAYDAKVLADRATRSVWPGIKKLIVLGYYTSEIGASQELIYDLVPGRYDSDIPYKPGDKTLSNDWDGNSLQ